MESTKRIVQPVSVILIASLLVACAEAQSSLPQPTALPIPTNTPFPSPEPLPTFEQDPSLEVHCAKDPIPEGGTITQAVQTILEDMGNEIDMNALMDQGWHIAAGVNNKVTWSDNARTTLTSHVNVAPGSKVCIGRNPILTEFQIEPPPPGDSLLPNNVRIFAGIPKGLSASKSSKPTRSF